MNCEKLRKQILAAVLGLLSVSAAACGSTGGSASEKKAVNIGVIIEQTGPLASLGLTELKAIQFAVKQANDTGGVNGRTIKLIVKNSESQPAVASAAARDFASRGDVHVVLGAATGASCSAINAILEPEGIMQFCLSPIATQPKPLLYWAQGPLADYHTFLVPWFAHAGITKIGIARTADATGDAMEKLIRDLVAKNPALKLVDVETFNSGATDVQTQLTKLREHNPDTIIGGVSGSNLLPVVQGMNALGLKQPLVVAHGSIIRSILELVKNQLVPGGIVGGLYWVDVPATEIPSSVAYRGKILEFTNAWKAAYGETPGHNEAGTYDATEQIIAALRDGAESGTQIDAKTQSGNFVGVLGPYHYSKTDRQGPTFPGGMLEFGRDGQFHLLFSQK
jgi:branched-chain amino acid transport system substrate-binding protein